jgi:hypothetical protein
MFTIKYRYFILANEQPEGGPPNYDENEMLYGPFSLVEQGRDKGFIIVTGYDDSEEGNETFGPFNTDVSGHPRPTLWVMNESGATVAKYDL